MSDSSRKKICGKCDWSMEVPAGTPEEILRNDCPKCSSPIFFEDQMEDLGSDFFDFLPQLKDEEIAGLELTEDREVSTISELDRKTISGFVNRWSPMILGAQILAEMMASGVELKGEDVIDKFTDTGTSYRRALREIEDRHGIPRGSRLSDGYPEQDEKAIRRFARTYMGADPTKGTFTEGSGIGQEMGLVALDYAQNNGEEVVTLKLTEVGSEALKIRLYRDPELETETHKAAGAGSVVLPRWLDEGGINRIFEIIRSRSNAEYLWIKFLLQQINSSIRGLTIADLVSREIEREMSEGQTKRWFRRGADVDIFTSMSKENASIEEIEVELEKKIISTITGTLGRMKELSLIFQFKRARQTFYKVTKSGRNWVSRWDSIALEGE